VQANSAIITTEDYLRTPHANRHANLSFSMADMPSSSATQEIGIHIDQSSACKGMKSMEGESLLQTAQSAQFQQVDIVVSR
jgi:hypothetical protein